MREIRPSTRFRVLRAAGWRCRYCGISSDMAPLEVDHIVPVAHGGSNAESNLIAACWSCNNGKRDAQGVEPPPIERRWKNTCDCCPSCEIVPEVPTMYRPELVDLSLMPSTVRLRYHCEAGHTWLVAWDAEAAFWHGVQCVNEARRNPRIVVKGGA